MSTSKNAVIRKLMKELVKEYGDFSAMDKDAQLNAVFAKAVEMAEALENINHQFTLLKKNYFGSKSESIAPEQIRKIIAAAGKIIDDDYSNANEPHQGELFSFKFEHLSIEAYKALCAEKIKAEQKANTADGPAETDDEPSKNQNGNKSAKKHKRQMGSKNTLTLAILKNCSLPKEYQQIDKEGDVAFCDTCGNPLTVIGKEIVSADIVAIPASFKVVFKERNVYKCEHCDNEGLPSISRTPNNDIPFIPHSYCSRSLASFIICTRFGYAIPYYRLENMFRQSGLPIDRKLMSKWVIDIYEKYLFDYVERLRAHLLKQTCLHGDETTIRVQQENIQNKKSNQSYLWVLTSNEFEKHPIRLFRYYSGRRGAYAAEMLNGYSGFFHSDKYGGYGVVPNITRCYCYDHLRRKFVEAVPNIKKITNIAEKRLCEYIRDIFDMLSDIYNADNQAREITSAEERKCFRNNNVKPLVDKLFAYFHNLFDNGKVLPKSNLGEAINYALSDEKGFYNFLDDGNCSLSNQISENSIRPFTVFRKNVLFAGSPRGAKAIAAIFSIIETAKANNLSIELFFSYLFKELPKLPKSKTDISALDKLMPWTPKVQELCHSSLVPNLLDTTEVKEQDDALESRNELFC